LVLRHRDQDGIFNLKGKAESMSMNDPKSIHAAEDWGVVLQSVPSKNKKEVVKRIEEIFQLEKRDAEQVLANTPLILVDNISFGLAGRIKIYFQKIGAVAETTNHEMIKKNCFQIVWPQTPDLSFFMKNEMTPGQEQKADVKAADAGSADTKATEIPKPVPAVPAPTAFHATPAPAPLHPPIVPKPVPAAPASAPAHAPIPPKPVHEAPAIPSHYMASAPRPVPEPAAPAQPAPAAPAEKPVAPASSGIDSDWERRAKELNEKLRRINEEKAAMHAKHAEVTEKVKQELHAQHTEVTEKVKSEYQQQIEAEKKKKEEIAKAYEDLQKQAQKHEQLSREGEEWKARAVALGEKVRELETNLMQKTASLEQLMHQKDELLRQSETVASNAKNELSALREREQEFFKKIAELERSVEHMAESLQSRDGALASFERQMQELAEKAQGYDSLRVEHAQLVRERATIRQEYDGRITEQEMRLAKAEEEHRRYRSRMDRKNAAATRELGEWIRGVDTIRQGLQKLILFLGSESAVLDTEKKSNLRSPLTRGPDAPNPEKY
jgi:hypothetical protein